MKIISKTLKLSLLFLLTGTAYAQSTVTFTGELTEQTCSVAAGSTGDDIKVPFGTIPISTFDADGVKSVTKDFTISLTDCPDVINTPSITFTGTEIKKASDGASIFANASSGGATNMGAVIYLGSDAVVKDTAMASNAVITGGEGTIAATANLIATGQAAIGTTDGKISVPVTFNISYN